LLTDDEWFIVQLGDDELLVTLFQLSKRAAFLGRLRGLGLSVLNISEISFEWLARPPIDALYSNARLTMTNNEPALVWVDDRRQLHRWTPNDGDDVLLQALPSTTTVRIAQSPTGLRVIAVDGKRIISLIVPDVVVTMGPIDVLKLCETSPLTTSLIIGGVCLFLLAAVVLGACCFVRRRRRQQQQKQQPHESQLTALTADDAEQTAPGELIDHTRVMEDWQ
jgi:hypothetical protein